MKPKRIISLLLAICLVAGLMPTVAFATESDKAIMLGTSGISGYDSAAGYDYIYFGSWTAQDTYTTSGPIKWRVLDDQTNTGETGLFLLSDGLLGTGYYGGVYFDNTSPYSNTWQGSDAQAWCNTFASSNLDSRELAAILETTKSDVVFTSSTYSVPFAASENILNGDKVFFLSAEEAENSAYGFANDNARIANYGGSACAWWLRSPYAGYTDGAGAVYGYGYVDFITVNDDWAARPAFNLDLTSVLFTSAAAGGKIPAASSGGNQGGEAGDAIFEIGDYDGSEWKLTLLDNSRNFAVTEEAASGKPGDTITLNYTGATTGTNEYISVIIADSNGSTLYYGRVAQPDSANGQVEIKIPDSLAAGEYTLNVFSEQYNGDYKTDYASAFAEVALTVEEAAAPGIDTGKAIQLVDSGTAANISGGQADNIYFGTYQQSSAGSTEPDGTEGVDWIKSDTANKNGQDPYYYIDPVKWRVLSNASGQLFLLSDQNLDVQPYNSSKTSITWEKSTIRSWLNGYAASKNNSGTDYSSNNFIDAAFSSDEQVAIADTYVYNKNNPSYNTSGGNDTTDRIFLLSIEEANNSSYFPNGNDSRKSTNTAYVASCNGVSDVGAVDEWWLRSPGYTDDLAAYVRVDGVVDSPGNRVTSTSMAVRPAFNLNLNSVLFTSAAEGGKSVNGMDSELTAVSDYNGNDWKLTLLDESRDFSISNATINDNDDTITFSYSGAQTGTNEYISVVIEDSGAITHYGRILQPESASGTASLTLPAGVTLGGNTKLYVFNEQYNGGEKDDTKLTDYASNLISVNVDTTAPTLTESSATRDSETTATVKFTSNEAGTYYYSIVDSGENEPDVNTSGTGTPCDTTEQTISLTNLSDTSAKDIYIVVKDAAGNVSDKLKIGIPAYVAPLYGISASPDALNFGSATEGYSSAPEAQTVTIQNTGNQTITLTQPAATDFNIGTLSTTELAAGDKATFTVQPKTGLTAGSHSETLTISGSGNASVQVALSFTVNTGGTSGGSTGGSTTDYYRLTFDTNGGSEIASIRRAEHTTIDLSGYTPTREGYEFTGWYADKDLTDKITSIRLTRNTTVYAGWEEKKENPGTGFENPFTDVSESDWFYDDVMFVFTNGLMVGTGDATFSPEISTSRAMIAVTLWRMEGEPAAKGANPYTDVENGAWYTEAITWADENGIAEGYGNGCFQPETPVTREQLAAFFYRYAAYKGYDITITGSLDHFNDKDNVSEWAKDTMAWAVGYGLIGGKDNNMLDPQGEATRAEFAAMLQRFCQKG